MTPGVPEVLRAAPEDQPQISINSQLYHNPKMISDCAKVYGSQSLVASVDIGLIEEKSYKVFVDGGKTIVEEDIKNLYSSGLVESVRVLTEPKGEGLRVIFLVQTRSTLGEISFIGNSIASNKLRKDTELEIGDSFDDSTLEKARVNLEDTYKKKGYSNVGITYKVDGAQRPGFSRVTFVVDEGALERLKKVKFFGNESFSDKVLSPADIASFAKEEYFSNDFSALIDGLKLFLDCPLTNWFVPNLG